MSGKLNAEQVLDREFLVVRSRMLDIGAALDRLDAATGKERIASDPRRVLLGEGLRLLASDDPNRAERLQLLFSDAYDPSWRVPR